MSDPIERIVNLALFLASATHPVSVDEVRREVTGYSEDQDVDAFLRMFERDKDDLRTAGFVIETDEHSRYYLDATATFTSEVSLAPNEVAALRAANSAALSDPSFPFRNALRLASAKLSASLEPVAIAATAQQADENPADQAEAVAALDLAVKAAKRVRFTYTNSRTITAPHEVEPFGLFLREGRWYLVGRDVQLDEVRVYAVARLEGLTVNGSRPKSPDFTRPSDFDVSRFIRLPFEYGGEEVPVTIAFDHSLKDRVPGLTAGSGGTRTEGDRILWDTVARDRLSLMRWVVENGPGIALAAPPELVDELAHRMKEVSRQHG